MKIQEYLTTQKPIDTEDETTVIIKILSEKEIPAEYIDAIITTYLKLLPLSYAGSLKENLPDPVNTARVNAAKLAISFETADQAIEYLKRFEASRTIDGFLDTNQLMHDACLFSVPEGQGWSLKLWQAIIKQQSPNHPNNLVMRLFPLAGKIEQYFRQNRAKIEAEAKRTVSQEVRDDYRKTFEQEYESKKKEVSNKDEFISLKLREQNKNITKKKDSLYESYLKKELKIVGKPTQDNIDGIRKRKSNPTHDDLRTKAEIDVQVVASASQEAEQDYDIQKKTMGISKEEYVQAKLLTADKEIQKTVNFKLTALLMPDSGKIPIATLVTYANAAGIYERSKENLAAAHVFFANFMPENLFNHYLELKPQDDNQKIPQARIGGAELSAKYQDYYLTKLAPNDPRAAILGKLTSCCQSLGEEGEDCVIRGITDPNSGFYVLCKKATAPNTADDIVAQCWAWRNLKGDLVFDSVESQTDFKRHNKPMIVDLYTNLAHQLVSKHNIPRVLVGAGGSTPKKLGLVRPFRSALHDGYIGYGDSKNQRVVCDQQMALFQLFNSTQADPAQQIKEADFSTITTESLLTLCDYLVHSKKNNLIDMVITFAKERGIDETVLRNRVELVQSWLSFISNRGQPYDLAILEEFLKKYPNLINIPTNSGMISDDQVLGVAIEKGDLAAVELLLKYGADINCVNTYSLSALDHACSKDQPEIANYLVDKYHLGLHVKNLEGQSLLHVAASNSASSTIKYLLTKKLDPNQLDNSGNRPIDYLLDAKKPTWEIVDLMLHKSDQVKQRFACFLLKEIFASNKPEFLKPLYSRCKNIFENSKHLNELLGNLIAERKWEGLKTLIKDGLSPNFCTGGNYSLLLSAIDSHKSGRLEKVTWLLDNGANIDQQVMDDGRTAIYHAAVCDSWNMVDLLIDRGASLENKTKYDPILNLAVAKGAWNTVEKLVIKGVDVSSLADEKLPENITRLIENRALSKTEFFKSSPQLADPKEVSDVKYGDSENVGGYKQTNS